MGSGGFKKYIELPSEINAGHTDSFSQGIFGTGSWKYI